MTTYDRERAIRHLRAAENAYDAQEAADGIEAARRRLRYETDSIAERVKRELRYLSDSTPHEEQRDIAHRERRRLERGW